MKHTLKLTVLCLGLSLALPGIAHAQTTHSHTDHMASGDMNHSGGDTGVAPTEGGQAAFTAIAEIVDILRADPGTDWQQVDIEGLRQHLIDMDAVTMHAQVSDQSLADGAVFEVTSDDPVITGSIRRMTLAHSQVMSGVDGIEMLAQQTDTGARLTVTGPNAALIRGLGFIGVLSLGMHHQAHHIALARGLDPHQH